MTSVVHKLSISFATHILPMTNLPVETLQQECVIVFRTLTSHKKLFQMLARKGGEVPQLDRSVIK